MQRYAKKVCNHKNSHKNLRPKFNEDISPKIVEIEAQTHSIWTPSQNTSPAKKSLLFQNFPVRGSFCRSRAAEAPAERELVSNRGAPKVLFVWPEGPNKKHLVCTNFPGNLDIDYRDIDYLLSTRLPREVLVSFLGDPHRGTLPNSPKNSKIVQKPSKSLKIAKIVNGER